MNRGRAQSAKHDTADFPPKERKEGRENREAGTKGEQIQTMTQDKHWGWYEQRLLVLFLFLF